MSRSSPHKSKTSPRSYGGSSVGESVTSGDEWYLRSLLGSQAESRHESAPSYGFGTSQRSAAAKMYQGPGSDKGRPARLSPGPIYASPQSLGGPKFSFGTGPAAGSCGAAPSRGSAQMPGPGEYALAQSVGPQASSLARSAPSYGWGSNVRDTGGGDGKANAAGASYDLNASVGPQSLSSKHNAPAFAMGTAQRFGEQRGEMRRMAAAPGPGSYALPEAVGASHESTKKSMPAYGFGTSTRMQANKVYWQGKTTAAEGTSTPGPSYQLKSSVGGQVQSDRRSRHGFGFGSASRFGETSKQRTPGPGEYNA